MMPAGRTRVLRKEQRRAWKGVSRGRRGTHRVRTTYGAGQCRAEWLASWAAWRAAEREDRSAA